MLRNYLTIALRNLRRHLGYTALNVLGLAVGMGVCLLVGLYIHDELRVDRFHEKGDRIVQLGVAHDYFGRSRATSFPLARVAASEVPAVECAVNTMLRGGMLVREATGAEGEHRMLAAGEAFFDVFTFPAVRGVPSEALRRPDGLVLTRSLAETYFGAEDPIGQSMTLTLWGRSFTLTVGAVVEDVPEASTISFDAVVPMQLLEEPSWADSWGRFMYGTYALLRTPDVDRTALGDQITQAVGQHTDRAPQYFAVDLSSVYLSDLYNAEGFRGEKRFLYVFGAVALFVLLIASINYVNLATTLGARRAREVSMRKAMGAGRFQLIRQFLGESVVISAIALVIALLLMAVALPVFNDLFGTHLAFGAGVTAPVLFALGAFGLGIGVAAGTYPAFVLTRVEPAQLLRQHANTVAGRGGWLRRGLVVTQFAMAVALIGGTAVVYQQLHFMQTKDLGFAGEQVVTVELPNAAWEARQHLEREARRHDAVRYATVANGAPGHHRINLSLPPDDLSARHRAEDTEAPITFKPAVVGYDYVETLGLELVAGRDFDRDRPSDAERAVILNETAVAQMGWTPEEAIGMPFSLGSDREFEVIGVVEDYHVEPLHREIEPVALQVREGASWSARGLLIARLRAGHIQAGLEHLEAQLAAIAPEAAFDYQFMDDAFDAAYRAEVRLSRIFTVVAAIAILLACLGLFALAAFAAQRRTKEIGIRKVLGASMRHIVGLLSREFAVLVAVAIAIGAPAAYAAAQQWLQDFAYRVAIGPWTFALTAALAVTIAGVSVGYQALRAARTDPAEALRYE